jgi:hypothetical protein
MHRFMPLIAAFLFFGCSIFHPPPLWQKTLPKENRSTLAARLNQAGSNRLQIEKAFDLTPRLLHFYLALLIERMPSVDLASCQPELLSHTAILADSLRQILPYAAALPEDIFRDYVLPLRVSQEPLEDFRPYFIPELFPLVKDCTSVEGAAVAINRWCGSKVRFQTTQSRDQGPFETLKSGFGRCEEMMIFFSDACRSLGVPAREAWTPWWPYQDNNHAWTEVWTSSGWKYTGACEPRDHLNEAWFSEPVKRAAFVVASKQGPASAGEEVYRKGERYSLINVTGNYTTVAPLKVNLVADNKPLTNCDVVISIFNFGSLRPLAKVITDSLGAVSISLGKGDYAVSTAGGQPNMAVVQHRPPADTHVYLDAGKPSSPSDSFWLRCDP